MAYNYRPDRGYLKTGDSAYPHASLKLPEDNGEKLHRVIVHRFTVGDVDDPILYAGEPLCKWENSDVGQWVKERGYDIEWRSQQNFATYGTDFVIIATLKESDYTFFLMKYV